MTTLANAMLAVADLVSLTGGPATVAMLGKTPTVLFDRVTYRLDLDADRDLLVALADAYTVGVSGPPNLLAP